MTQARKKWPMFLSYSRAYAFKYEIESFIQKYIFHNLPTAKATWDKGNMVQDLVYAIIQNKQIEECKDKREHNKLQESGVFGIYKDLIDIHRELLAVMPLIVDFEKNKPRIEQAIVNSNIKAIGYTDILLPSTIIDIKTCTGSIESWERTNSMIRLGLQNYLYQKILQKEGKEPPLFYFLIIEAVFPFRVRLRQFPEYWINACERLFQEIQTEYLEWIYKVGKMVCDITGHSMNEKADDFWFQNPDNNKFKTEIYKKFDKENIIDIETSINIPARDQQDIGYSENT